MPAVPEFYIKNHISAVARAQERAERLAKQQIVSQDLKNHAIASYSKFEKEYQEAAKAIVAAEEAANKAGNFYIPAEAKMFLVIRIKGITKMSPQQRQILSLFRLKQVNSAVFIKCNKATLNALRYVQHFVTWGEPTVDTIRKLVYARGYCNLNKERIPICDNNCINEKLGKFEIKCAEDLVHELFTVGKNFKEANTFLWPFKLQARVLVDKRISFTEGGDFGFRGHYINEFVEKMI